jgi:hypothetical protein
MKHVGPMSTIAITWSSVLTLAAGRTMPARGPVGLETSPPKGDTRDSAE